jgi:hypothetical protein
MAGDGWGGRKHPSCASKASYRYRYRYRRSTSGFRDVSYNNNSYLRLFFRYLLLTQLLQWVFCGIDLGDGSGSPYICMVASWTTGTVVLNHSGRRIFAATTASTSSTPTTRAFQSSPFSLYSSEGADSSSTAAAEINITTTTDTTTDTTTATTAAIWDLPTNMTKGSPDEETRARVNIHRLPGVHRVHCISDLHVDNPDNLRWLESRCRPLATSNATSNATSISDATSATNPDDNFETAPPIDGKIISIDTHCNVGTWDETDMIVVAGDISHKMDRIEHSLRLLKQTGAHVVFVPGNHEAWLTPSSPAPHHLPKGSSSSLSSSSSTSSLPSSQQSQSHYSSLSKLENIETLCRKLGVYTTGDCVCVGGAPEDVCSEIETEIEHRNGPLSPTPTEELWILPLDSWYDGSLSFVDLECAPNTGDGDDSSSPPYYDLVRDFGKWPWVDFQQCHWPSWLFQESNDNECTDNANGNQNGEKEQPQTPPRSPLLKKIPIGLVDYYLKRNQPVIDAFHNATRSSPDHKRISVLTVTHFLPNQQSLPDWKDLDSRIFRCDSWLEHGAGGMSAKFALVGGSDKIDAQIRSLSAGAGLFHRQMHVFGHSHRPKDFVYEGIRYVHNPLGKPREREMHMVDPDVEIKLLWEVGSSDGDETENGSTETILRYWEERGGGLEMLLKRMDAGKRNRKLRRSQQQKR